MIKAVIFDMFETLVTLFEGRTYFSEDIAADLGIDPEVFRHEWPCKSKTVYRSQSKHECRAESIHLCA